MNSSKRYQKIFLSFLLVVALLFGAARIYYRLTDDFRISNMTYDFLADPKWQAPSLDKEEQANLLHILNQPYTYLGKGAQIYAFLSADGNYVLKFFKFKHLRPDWYLEWFPPIPLLNSIKEKQKNKREAKLHSIFSGYQLAYDLDKENTGILYLHLNPKKSFNFKIPPVLIIDKMGIARSLNLQTVVFVIQRKGETLRSVMQNLLNQGNVEKAKEKFNQIIEMYADEYQKGLWDRDHGVMHNTGFENGKPFHLDVGKFSFDLKMKEAMHFKPDLQLVLHRVTNWISLEYPKYKEEIVNALKEKIAQVIGEENP